MATTLPISPDDVRVDPRRGFLDVWTFVALTLTALLLGTSFGHFLELPAKMELDGPLWMTLQQHLYRRFATIGGVAEIGSLASLAVLAFLVRDRSRPFVFTLIAATCVAAAFFGVWLLATRPVNAELARWTADTLPADWERWRIQWEVSHVARFVLHLAGLGALVIGVLARRRVE